MKFARTLLIVLLSATSIQLTAQKLSKPRRLPITEISDTSLQLSQGIVMTQSVDSDWIYRMIRFDREGVEVLADTFDIYSAFKFRLFDLPKVSYDLLLMELEGEYFSEYPLYMYSDSDFRKIGTLDIRLDCDNCDVLNYPIDDIVIKGNKQQIEFTFNTDLKVVVEGQALARSKKDVKYIYHIVDGVLMLEQGDF